MIDQVYLVLQSVVLVVTSLSLFLAAVVLVQLVSVLRGRPLIVRYPKFGRTAEEEEEEI